MKILKDMLLSALLATAALAETNFTVNPTPLNGNGGGINGWGFTLNNETSGYLSVDGVQLFSLVDTPVYRFGPSSNFTELFATYQFNAANILIGPNSVYTLAYNGSDQGLATWNFPVGDAYGHLVSNVFQIQLSYSLFDDNAYTTQIGAGTLTADAQLEYTPEPSTWLLLGTGLGLIGLRRLRQGRYSLRAL